MNMNIYNDVEEENYSMLFDFFPSNLFKLENFNIIKTNILGNQNNNEEPLYLNDINIMKTNSIGKNSIETSFIKINNNYEDNSIEKNLIKNKSMEINLIENNNNNSIESNSIECNSIESNYKYNNNLIERNSKYNDILIDINSKEKNNNYEEEKLFIKRKRGGKSNNIYRTDNIFKRITVHYLNSIIMLLNEVINNLKLEGIKGKFKMINYNFKRYFNKTKFNQIKKNSLNYFLILENNNKYKNKNLNKTLYTQIEAKSKTDRILNRILNKIMSNSYIDIFKDIYYKNNKDINFEGLLFHIPRTFDDFLEKKEIKGDILYKQKILEVVRKSFLEYIFTIEKI